MIKILTPIFYLMFIKIPHAEKLGGIYMKKSIIYNYLMEVKASNATMCQVQGTNKKVLIATKDEFIHFITVQPEVIKRLIKTNEGFKAFIRFDV